MWYIVSLLIFLYSTNFRNSLLSFRNLELDTGDSLLNVAFFESDSLLKNDILFLKEVLAKYRDTEEVKSLAKYYLHFYFSYPIKGTFLKKTKLPNSSLINYLKLLDCLSRKNRDFRSCEDLLNSIDDTLLIFHGAFLVVKKFENSHKRECKKLLEHLVKNYPQTPYSEIASGYLRLIGTN